jgi:hypothetical protein
MTTNSDLAAEGRATALEKPNMSPPRLNRAEAWRKLLRPITEVFKSVSLMIQSSTTSRLRWKFQPHIKATFFLATAINTSMATLCRSFGNIKRNRSKPFNKIRQ